MLQGQDAGMAREGRGAVREDDGRRTFAHRYQTAVQAVACPFCKTPAGERCRALRAYGPNAIQCGPPLSRGHKERLQAHAALVAGESCDS